MGTDKTDNRTCEIIYGNFTCENYRFVYEKVYENGLLILFKETFLHVINIKIHGCLEIPYLFLVLNMISYSFAALTRVILRSTLEINMS